MVEEPVSRRNGLADTTAGFRENLDIRAKFDKYAEEKRRTRSLELFDDFLKRHDSYSSLSDAEELISFGASFGIDGVLAIARRKPRFPLQDMARVTELLYAAGAKSLLIKYHWPVSPELAAKICKESFHTPQAEQAKENIFSGIRSQAHRESSADYFARRKTIAGIAALQCARDGDLKWLQQFVSDSGNPETHRACAALLVHAPQLTGEFNYFAFEGIDKKDYVALIKRGVGDIGIAAENAISFDQDLALLLVEISRNGDESWGARRVAHWLSRFHGLDFSIALKLIEAGGLNAVLNHKKAFGELSHTTLASFLLEQDKADLLIDSMSHFRGLTRDMAVKLINAGYGDGVINHMNSFERAYNAASFVRDAVDNQHPEVVAYADLSVLMHHDTDKKLSSIVDREKLEEMSLLPCEYYALFGGSSSLAFNTRTEEGSKELFTALIPAWNDEENISGPFREGAEYFGYRKLFQYIGTYNRHDALYNFRSVVSMARGSGLPPGTFFVQILEQVINDKGVYGDQETDDEAGEAITFGSRSRLNSIVDIVRPSEISNTLTKAKEFAARGIPQLQELVDTFKDQSMIFKSWKNLKQYHSLVELLGRAEVLEQLPNISDPKARAYIHTLAFHPNVDTNAVLLLWEDPRAFFDIGDVHSTATHERKKPGNYLDRGKVPFLDLSSDDLRDALIEGSLDRLQTWSPMEIVYKLPADVGSAALLEGSLQDIIKRALGSRRDTVAGKALNPGVLFGRLNTLFKSHDKDLLNYLAQEDLSALSRDFENELRSVLFDEKIGLPIRTNTYRAKIALKSDPDAAVATNDIPSCMPFGSGKQNVYMMNPVVAQFVLQRQNSDGEWRAIAQSVMTKDTDINRNVTDILTQASSGHLQMDTIVDEGVLRGSPHIMTADNIEAAPNITSNRFITEEIVVSLYKDFYREYAKQFGAQEGLDADRILIGPGYIDVAAKHFTRIPNTFVPLAPVGYSDNVRAETLALSLGGDVVLPYRKVMTPDKPARYDLDRQTTTQGVSHLDFHNTLQVAYIEGKAYADNTSLMEYLHNLENMLIAKDITNTHKGRQNMSFKYTDASGAIRGYLIAYEGTSDDEQHREEYEDAPGTLLPTGKEKVLYVADLAADPKSAKAGGSLLLEFASAYADNYLAKGEMVPIVARARGKTSYAIVKKQIENLASQINKRLGSTRVTLKIEEDDNNDYGEEVMHWIRIVPLAQAN